MQEMIYTRDHAHIVLDTGTYKGYQYLIKSLGTHPTAYVKIPDTHPYYEADIFDCADIECHFGLTYAAGHLYTPDEKLDGWWLGWDYAHCTDYAGYYADDEYLGHLKKWTTEEIKQECYRVIDQFAKKELKK